MIDGGDKNTLREIPWPYNLIEVLQGWCAAREHDEQYVEFDYTAKGILAFANETLTPRERQIIETRYGAHGGGCKSLKETAAAFGISTERCRKIEAKIIRKMVNPYKLKRYAAVPMKCWQAERNARLEAEEREKVANDRLRWVLENCTYQMKPGIEPITAPENVGKQSADNITISDMELSVRSYNCLKRAGHDTLGDVLKIPSEEDAMRIRNLGRRSWDEVKDKVHSLGYKFIWEHDEHEDR